MIKYFVMKIRNLYNIKKVIKMVYEIVFNAENHFLIRFNHFIVITGVKCVALISVRTVIISFLKIHLKLNLNLKI